jgi:hypothetical protein
VPPFCRLSYYTGKLLTARDFLDEQRYHIDKRRLHNVLLHGWGVVCGLRVKPHPHCPALRIVVEAGLAIDACGREVRLLEDVELALPQMPPPRAPSPCPLDPATRSEVQAEPQGEAECEAAPAQEACAPLWICLRYCEREEQFSLAPFDECACTGAVQKPNRVCESYVLELSNTPPMCIDDVARHKDCGCADCTDLYEHLDRCEPFRCDCIPLAVVRGLVTGDVVLESMIDNWTHRPLLPSVHRLDRVVRCILEKLPRQRLTHISDINWTHGEDLRCHEFNRRFVEHGRGFEIEFDYPVRKEGLTPRTFQAMVVHHAGRPDEPQRVEIAPAHLDFFDGTDEITRVRLRIDEQYAQRHLDERNFDLFITLKCNVVVDIHGVPVDGDLVARLQHDGTVYVVDAPTGNGVPGGLFESWVRVRTSDPRADLH